MAVVIPVAKPTIKLPEIPRDVNHEYFRYFTQLHVNLQALEERIRLLEAGK